MLAFASHPAMSSPQSGNGPSSSSSASSGVKHSARKSSFGFSSSSSGAGLASSGSRPRAGVSFAYQVAPSRSQPAGWSSSSSRQPQPISASKSASTSTPAHPPPPTTTTAAPSSSSSSTSASSWTTSLVSSSSLPSTATPPIPASPTLGPSNPSVSYDISAYSSSDLLKLLASLLTQIASTNDALTAAASSPSASASSSHHTTSPHPATSPTSAHSPVHQRHHTPIWQTLTTASRSALGTHSSTLTFHARNIPSITLEAYLLRILKYCPTTNHVFLSLLVYFDRMARMSGEIEGEYDDEDGEGEFSGTTASVGDSLAGSGEGMDVGQEHRRPDGMEVDHDVQMPHTIQTQTMNISRRRRRTGKGSGRSFVIDSYNIHRLVIAGVTVASKFFSDVFYTNGRYAKVGGLPLHELNQLELQFLLLNDFRLVITQSEMQRYAEQLILFSRSQANPIVLKVDRGLGIAGGDHEAKARALLEGREPEREGSRPHLNGKPKPASIAPQPPFMARTAESAVDQQPQHKNAHLSHFQSPFPSGGSSSTGPHQPYHSAFQTGPRGVPLPGPPQSQTPKMGAASSSSSSSHDAYAHPTSQRQGEFSRAYESDDDSDSDDDDDHRDDQSYHTETETEAETDAGETDASGSTTSDEPTVRPRRPYAGRRESMGSMMSSEADSDAGGRDEAEPVHSESASGASGERVAEEGERKDVVDVDGVQKTPEVTRTRQSDRMLVDMDTA